MLRNESRGLAMVFDRGRQPRTLLLIMHSKSIVADQVYKSNLRDILYQAGLLVVSEISDALQGNIWKALHLESKELVVVKVINKSHEKQRLYSDISTESQILEFVSADPKCSQFIIKHYALFSNDSYYYLVMEHGGNCFFDFIAKVHRFIQNGNVSKHEWHRAVRYLFKQMLNAVQYLHSKNVCHFDISLENFCINDLEIELENGKFTFCINEADNVRIKLIDFGFAKSFKTGSDFMNERYCGKTAYFSPEICNRVKFNAKKNDIWCLGICLFMMVFGSAPWKIATLQNVHFMHMMARNGDITFLLKLWDNCADEMLVDLFKHFFQFEDKRADLETIKQHQWLQEK